MEGWLRAFQHGMGFSHPTLPKFLSFLRKEQNWTEVKIARTQAGEQPRKDTKNFKSNKRLKTVLSIYQNNRIRSLLGLANNFEF